MKKLNELIVVFGFGGIIYCLVEIIYRGYTHWTMLLTGGAVFTVLYMLNIKLKSRGMLPRCFLGCLIITAAEFIVGCIVNIGFDMHVWDYSHEKFNVLGQICPAFSFAWFLICIPAAMLSFLLRRNLRDEG